LRADIVVSGIPQSTEPLADALIDLIQPRLIVITDAEYPATARASKKLRQRLARRNIPVLYTRETGAVTVRFQSHGWQIKTMNRMNPLDEKIDAPATDE
jgi:beta-lactamase superfamily II metal-dependent hydrolase